MRHLILLLVSLLFCVNCYAVDLPTIIGLDRAVSVEEEDGSPSVLDVKKIIVSNGIVTDNGDGTVLIKISKDAIPIISSSTDNAIACWDGTSGNLLQNSLADIDDSGNLNATSYEIGGLTVLKLFSTSSIGVGTTTGAGGDNDDFCTFVGIDAGRTSTTYNDNTCIGYEAGELSVDDGNDNTFIGYRAGKGSAGLFSPTWNTCVGSSAGLGLTTGDNNVFLGGAAGGTNTVGSDNVFIGYQAGTQALDGDQNVAIGSYAGWYGDDNKFNVFIGYYSGNGTSTPESQGDDNTAIGWSTMIGYSSAFDNTVLGYSAGNDITTGDNNIFIGHSTGDQVTTGSSNIIIGYQIDAPAVDTANYINLGNKFIYDDTKGEVIIPEDITIEDATPHQTFRDTDTNDAMQWHFDMGDQTYGIYQLWRGTDDGTGFDVNPNQPIIYFNSNNNMFTLGEIRTISSLYRRYYYLPVDSFNPGASGATWISANANHRGGWNLTASTDTLEFGTDLHSDWDGASDLTIEFHFCLNASGSANDTVDLRLQCFYNTDGDTATKTQTVEVATVTDETQYKVYQAVFVLNWDELNNILEAGDAIGFILNLETDTSEIDNIILLQGNSSYYYNITHIGIEAGDV